MVRLYEENTEDFPQWWEEESSTKSLVSVRPADHSSLSSGCQKGCLEETDHLPLDAAFSSLVSKRGQWSSLLLLEDEM